MKFKIFFLLLSALSLSACVGTVIDATADAVIAVAKVPFKVAGAAVDVVAGDEDEESEEVESE